VTHGIHDGGPIGIIEPARTSTSTTHSGDSCEDGATIELAFDADAGADEGGERARPRWSPSRATIRSSLILYVRGPIIRSRASAFGCGDCGSAGRARARHLGSANRRNRGQPQLLPACGQFRRFDCASGRAGPCPALAPERDDIAKARHPL
jgi:hypothetical protein